MAGISTFTIAFNSDKSIMQSPSISAIISAKTSMDTRILGFQSLIEGGEVPWASSTNPHISHPSIQPPRINPWLVGPADRKGWLYSVPILQNAGSLLEIQLSIYRAFSRRICSTSYSGAGGVSLFLTDISTPLFLHSFVKMPAPLRLLLSVLPSSLLLSVTIIYQIFVSIFRF